MKEIKYSGDSCVSWLFAAPGRTQATNYQMLDTPRPTRYRICRCTLFVPKGPFPCGYRPNNCRELGACSVEHIRVLTPSLLVAAYKEAVLHCIKLTTSKNNYPMHQRNYPGYRRPLNNMGFNHAGPQTQIFFFFQSILQYYTIQGWLNLWVWKGVVTGGLEQPKILVSKAGPGTSAPRIPRADCSSLSLRKRPFHRTGTQT